MSFNWGLSSDEEAENEESNTSEWSRCFDDKPFLFSGSDANENEKDIAFLNDHDDDEEVDWEDAEDCDNHDDMGSLTKQNDTSINTLITQKQFAIQSREITIDLEEKPTNDNVEEKDKKRQRIRRTKWRNDHLPDTLQQLVQNLHQTHLLILTSRAAYVSQLSSHPELLATCLSIIPTVHQSLTHCRTTEKNIEVLWCTPSINEVEFFLEWFHIWQPQRQRRPIMNRRYGRNGKNTKRKTKRKASLEKDLLDSYKPQKDTMDVANLDRLFECLRKQRGDVWSSMEVVQLCLCMMRSLGWRVRYVQAMESIPLDLQEDHPLLQSCMNVFKNMHQRIQHYKVKKRQVSHVASATPEAVDEEDDIIGRMDCTSTHSPKREYVMGWIEVLCRDKGKSRWIHVEPKRQVLDRPDMVEYWWDSFCSDTHSPIRHEAKRSKIMPKRKVLDFALSVEHATFLDDDDVGTPPVRFTDVTPRYAESYVASLRKRGIVRGKTGFSTSKIQQSWWSQTLKVLNKISHSSVEVTKELARLSSGRTNDEAIVLDMSDDDRKPSAKLMKKKETIFDEVEHNETQELKKSIDDEAIPTSKVAFKTSPIYVIPSLLNQAEVIAPGAKFCGVFKGEFVYRRTDVSTAHPARKWLYLGRQVYQKELGKPIRRIKARPKAAPKLFKALKTYGVGSTNDGSEKTKDEAIALACKPLEDDVEKLYAMWQTEPWSPEPVGPNDKIPVNEFNNIELEILNPGLVHIDERGAAAVAKKLGIPYAPCLLGFEGHHGNRTPTIRGVVVHEHNAAIVYDASMAVASQQLEEENEKHRNEVLLRWKKLMVGLLTKDRIEREYGDNTVKK